MCHCVCVRESTISLEMVRMHFMVLVDIIRRLVMVNGSYYYDERTYQILLLTSVTHALVGMYTTSLSPSMACLHVCACEVHQCVCVCVCVCCVMSMPYSSPD